MPDSAPQVRNLKRLQLKCAGPEVRHEVEASADRPLMGKVVKWKWGKSKSPRNIIDAVVNELNRQGRENYP